MSTEIKYDVFISYRRKGGGSERAQLLKARFLLVGYKKNDIFVDVSAIPSGDYRKNITDAIEASNNFVVVMSPNCFDNVCKEDREATDIEKIKDCYVYEIAKALQMGKNVIPVLFDGFDFDKEKLPEVLSSLAFYYQNAIVYSRDYPEASFDKLMEFVVPRPKPTPIPSLWENVRNSIRTHRRALTITISVSLAVLLMFPLGSLFNDIFSNSPQEIASTESLLEGNSSSDSLADESSMSSDTTTYTANGISFDMVKVEGGTFTMGATSEQGSDAWDNEKPTHRVTLSDYMIAKTEVTQELWQAVMGSNPSNFDGDNLPVEQVSWNDCQEFIKKLNSLTGLNFRLPTEAEWEYAARGGNKSKGYKYSGSNDIGSVAWYYENSGNSRLDDDNWEYDKLESNKCRTHEVATKSPNELGLYDMSGNVYEWCSDWYGDYSRGSQTNPKGPSSGSYRVICGGSWYNNARVCRVSFRYSSIPNSSRGNLGLRLAL